MRYYALACDYDGTLALNGQVDDKMIAALERLRNSGRKLLLVTGRELDEMIASGKIIDGKTIIGFLAWKWYGGAPARAKRS